jgi:alkylhydroperoxidase family enzyme
MARISYVEKAQAAPEVQPIFERFEKALGRVPNIFKAMAHAPVFLQKFMEFDGAMRSTKVDRKLRELVYLKASQVNRCEY